jgi:hypothetical protein
MQFGLTPWDQCPVIPDETVAIVEWDEAHRSSKLPSWLV